MGEGRVANLSKDRPLLSTKQVAKCPYAGDAGNLASTVRKQGSVLQAWFKSTPSF